MTRARGNILVVGAFHIDSFGLHIAETLESMGHGVARFETSFRRHATASKIRKQIESARTRISEITAGLPVARERFVRRLLKIAGSRPFEATVVCHDFLRPDDVERVRTATGAPVALWFPDAISRFGRAWFLNADYDGLFFKDPYIVDVLERTLDKPVFYLPECFNPDRHSAMPLDDAARRRYGCDVCTAGNLYSYRAEFFSRLAMHDVRIWGNPPPLWMKTDAVASMIQNRYLVNADKAQAFRAARVCVNNLNPAEIFGLNARAFEIAGCGGFQLLDWRPALSGLFEDGSELVSFSDMEDLLAKIDDYLGNDSARAEIARNGCRRAHAEHTYRHRLELLLDTLRGDAAGYPMPRIEMRRVG